MPAPLPRITLDADVMGGKPCIRGQRVTVGTIVGLVATGHGSTEILKLYPYLEDEDIRQALAYAAWRAEELDSATLVLPTQSSWITRGPTVSWSSRTTSTSGCCWRELDNRIELAAIIYEGRWDIGIVFARPTTLISDEGIVATAPPGVNRPVPAGG